MLLSIKQKNVHLNVISGISIFEYMVYLNLILDNIDYTGTDV